MTYTFYVDLETTVNGGPDGDSPEAHWNNNKVLLCGYKRIDSEVYINDNCDVLCDHLIRMSNKFGAGDQEIVIVAHNAKFDLKYLMRDRPDVPWHKIRIHDTMTWEYRATGHKEKFISLEKLAKKYGITFKKSIDLGLLLSKGIKMEDIPTPELKKYLTDDIDVLQKIYEAQIKQGYECDMNYILPLCEMELNGMVVDEPRSLALQFDLCKRTVLDYDSIKRYLKGVCEWQDGSPITEDDFTSKTPPASKCINVMSSRTLSFLLTGYPLGLQVTPKWKVQYATGVVPLISSTELMDVYGEINTTSNMGFPMGEDELSKILIRCPRIKMIPIILRYRTDNKLLSTYITPFLNTIKVQGTIHPSLNTTATGTGRLSSSGPNGQNIPPVARKLIIPRTEGGEIIELDFKQLEMVAAAILSDDGDMLTDITDGEDLHFNSGKDIMGWSIESDMTEEGRKIVKGVNFGVLYGGKPNGLSKKTGAAVDVVKELIKSFFDRYPAVARWQRSVFEEVVDNMQVDSIKDGEQTYKSLWTDPISKRRFLFTETVNPPWLRRKTGRRYSFSPQQTSNYPVQGFAGGDIVLTALYLIWKSFKESKYDVKFIMTVHDSIVMESNLKLVTFHYNVAKAIDKTIVKLKLPVDIDYSIKRDTTWS